MIVRLHRQPFAHPRDRASRLPLVVLGGLAFGLLALWNPVTTPGPVLCLSRLCVGVPCPFCGATRGVALCLRGQPLEGSRYNPLAVPSLLTGLLLLSLWSYEYLSGFQVEVRWRKPTRLAFFVVVHLAILAAWVYVLAYRREDEFSSSWLGRAIELFW